MNTIIMNKIRKSLQMF